MLDSVKRWRTVVLGDEDLRKRVQDFLNLIGPRRMEAKDLVGTTPGRRDDEERGVPARKPDKLAVLDVDEQSRPGEKVRAQYRA